MGLFSALGFGGGKLDTQLAGKQFTAGGELRGRVIFKAGKRQQEVKSITANVRVTTYKMELGPNGPHRTSQTDAVIKDKSISGPFVSQPGNSYEYELQMALPADLYNSDPDVEYRLSVSADIDGEVDPGDGEAFTVSGGRTFPKVALPVAMPAPAAGVPMMPPAPEPVVGADVLAQWTDGSWQQAKVISIAGSGIAVDWLDPRFGASMWVQRHQVVPSAAGSGQSMLAGQAPVGAAPQAFPGQGAAGQGFAGQQFGQPHQAMPPAFHGQNGPSQPFPSQQFAGPPTPGQAFAGPPIPGQSPSGQGFGMQQAAGSMTSGQAPPGPGAVAGGQTYAVHQFSSQPMPGQSAAGMPFPQAPLGAGTRVFAQWQDGNWYPGTVVQMQGSMIGVDWEDARLGSSSWVQAHQVQQR